MLKIRVPSHIGRRTKTLDDGKKCTAKEWENFILYYSLPILEIAGVENKYLEYWSLLVNSLFILLSVKITFEKLDQASYMLRQFVGKTFTFFGLKAMTYNVHQLIHIPESVYNFGPL